MLSYDGPRVGNEDLATSNRIKVMLSLSQTLDSERDPDKNCKKYPSSGFSNYRECDEHLSYEEFKKNFRKKLK